MEPVQAWYYVYDTEGDRLGSLSGQEGELVGFSDRIIVLRKFRFYYFYDVALERYMQKSVDALGEIVSVHHRCQGRTEDKLRCGRRALAMSPGIGTWVGPNRPRNSGHCSSAGRRTFLSEACFGIPQIAEIYFNIFGILFATNYGIL